MKTRDVALRMNDPIAREGMLEVAAGYGKAQSATVSV